MIIALDYKMTIYTRVAVMRYCRLISFMASVHRSVSHSMRQTDLIRHLKMMLWSIWQAESLMSLFASSNHRDVFLEQEILFTILNPFKNMQDL